MRCAWLIVVQLLATILGLTCDAHAYSVNTSEIDIDPTPSANSSDPLLRDESDEEVKVYVRKIGPRQLPASDYIHLWLSFKRKMWEDTTFWNTPAHQGRYTDTKVPDSLIEWSLTDLHPRDTRGPRLGRTSVLGVQEYLEDSDPDQRWLEPIEVNVVSVMPGFWHWQANLRGDINGVATQVGAVNSSTQNDIQALQKSVLRRQGGNGSMDLGFSEAQIFTTIHKPLLPDAVPYLDFAKIIIDFLIKWVYPSKYKAKVSDEYSPRTNGRTSVMSVINHGLILRVDLSALKQAERDVMFSDFEQLLRSFIVAPELLDDPQVFEATATLLSKSGGMGPPFVKITLSKYSTDVPASSETGVNVMKNVSS